MRFNVLMFNSILLYLLLVSNEGIMGKDVECDCNNHADKCNQETGECACLHNTTGPNCEVCEKGYYGYPLDGTPTDCRPCPCPSNGPCVLEPNTNEVICTECPEGQTGSLCERCDDNYYGDPMASGRESQPCQKCDCNQNINPKDTGNCNGMTGECLKCLYNTEGFNCERCKKGFYGEAQAGMPMKPGLPNMCQPCWCDILGAIMEPETSIPICDNYSGECLCKKNVIGMNCDQCADGFWKIATGEGCEPCECDPVGSTNVLCDLFTGQCNCRPGFTGQQCEKN